MKISWKEIDNFVEEVSLIIEDKWEVEYTGVYGPPRGGLTLAVMFSHRLSLPLLATPSIGCLIVDDIADSGVTLKKYADDYDIITVAYHNDCSFEPKWFKYEKIDDDWVVFPWEERIGYDI